MSTEPKEVLLTVPAELTRKCKGLALDMGGSLLKFVFRTKEDFDNANAQESKFSRLHLVSLPRNSLEEGLEYIKKNAYFRTDENKDETQELFTTGIGCTEFGKLINETLNIRLTNISEFDCFVKTFVYLAEHLPRSELLENPDVEALTDPLKQARSQLAAMQLMQGKDWTEGHDFKSLDLATPDFHRRTGQSSGNKDDTQPLAEEESDLYPCMLAMCGSGFGFIKIEKGGKFTIVDSSMRSGRNFLGIGSLLTGAKSFDELIELASKGNQRNVDLFTDELCSTKHASEDDDTMYGMLKDMHATCAYSFGKAASGSGEFRAEDIARSWLYSFSMDLAQTIQLVCATNNVKRVFFCGGFCANPLVRFFITQELTRRNLLGSFMLPTYDIIKFDFIKAGQHLGALGCMLNGVN